MTRCDVADVFFFLFFFFPFREDILSLRAVSTCMAVRRVLDEKFPCPLFR